MGRFHQNLLSIIYQSMFFVWQIESFLFSAVTSMWKSSFYTKKLTTSNTLKGHQRLTSSDISFRDIPNVCGPQITSEKKRRRYIHPASKWASYFPPFRQPPSTSPLIVQLKNAHCPILRLLSLCDSIGCFALRTTYLYYYYYYYVDERWMDGWMAGLELMAEKAMAWRS